ncbi:hypothetical protein A33Q_2685 [Indibacter alkaliphilus LW1]|uniref:Uncharacterized protein n=2 Tax=Indibacter TaxID=647744 RepID=S2DA69_INDAL|nr:hypothetical protein A33Q_2685 [Indibacter alkaliphilus LW1]
MLALHKIFRSNKPLAWFGFLNFSCFFIFLILSLMDHRELLGLNVWVKPMKFAISIGVFSWTMAWLLRYLPQVKKAKIISWVIVVMMSLELSIIALQSGRGVTSHFNVYNFLDLMLFNTMGYAIVMNTLMVAWALLLFRNVKTLKAGYKLGIQLGMLIFVLASLQGFVMVGQMSHTVGAPDGQEGIFFLNWAKKYGDLRIAHFLGLHALQLLPLFAWYFSAEKKLNVWIFALGYFILSVGALAMAYLI